jgi:hypothetical protein
VDHVNTTGNTGSGGTWTAGAVSSTTTNDLVLGFGGTNNYEGTVTATSPWTGISISATASNGLAALFAYQVVSSSTSYTPTGAYPNGWQMTAFSIAYKGN